MLPRKKIDSSLRNNRSINLNLSDHVRFFVRENMTIAVYKVKKESMFVLYVMI